MITFILFIIIICFFFLLSGVIPPAYYPISTGLYILLNVWYLSRYKKNQLVCPELFFAVFFYLSSLLAPTLLVTLSNTNLYISKSPNSIFHSYMVAYIGYYFYMLGLIIVKNKEIITKGENIKIICTPKDVNRTLNILTSLFIVLMLLNGGRALYTMYSNPNTIGANRLDGFGSYLTFSIITYSCSIMTNITSIDGVDKMPTWSIIRRLSPLFIINSIFLTFSFLISGYRSQAIQIILPILFIYNCYIRRIKLKTLALLFLGGFFLFSIIGFTRDGSHFNFGDRLFISYFRDFFCANSANVFLIEHTDSFGPAFSNTLFQILSIVPGLQGLVSKVIDTSSIAPSSSSLYTDYYNTGSGLGTNIIGDLYYSFGFLGMMACMFALGLFLSFLNRKHKKNPYVLIALLIFTGNSVFMSRVEFFYLVRTMSFAVIIYFLVSQFFSLRQSQKYR